MTFRPPSPSATTALCGAALVLLFGLCATPVLAQMPEDLPVAIRMERLSLDEYVEQLRSLSAQLEAGAPAAEITAPVPQVWLVEWEGQRNWIETGWLTDNLADLEENAEDSDTGRERLAARLATVIHEAEIVQAGGEELLPIVGARFHLEEILLRPEFGLVREPTFWELLLARFWQWMGEMFDTVHEKTGGMLWWTRYLLWVLIPGLALLVLYHIVRNMHVNAAEPLRSFPTPLKPDRNAAAWWQDARQAARDGDWRTALHNGYWAFITRMTEQDRWPEDYSRTHREYLALLARDNPLWNPAREVTFRFERTWYGGSTATESDFEMTRSLWESLHADPS